MQGDHPGGAIRWRMHIPAPIERVYRALSSNEGRASFWAESAAERDGVIAFKFVNGVEYHARVVARVEPRRFALDYFGGVATFELSETHQGGTDLLLVHEGVSVEEWNETHAGWLNVLFPLKAMLGYGIDLRNHDARRTWELGYADQ